jgi:peptide deformylase
MWSRPVLVRNLQLNLYVPYIKLVKLVATGLASQRQRRRSRDDGDYPQGMAIRGIRLFGDPILKTEADPVRDFDKQLRNLVRDLTETLDDAQGAGLAAPQIGVGLRVFVYAVGSERGHLVNPEIDFPDDAEQDGEEGCLSFPGIYYDVKRRLNTVARGFTDRGDPVQVVGTEVLARCLQHETDHLDGVLFIDRMDQATRKQAMKAIRAANWDGPVKVSPHRMTDRIF